MDYDLEVEATKTFVDPRFEPLFQPAYDRFSGQIQECDRASRRSMGLLVATLLGFELLMAAKIDEVSLLGVAIKDPAWLMLLLPVLASLLWANALVSLSTLTVYERLFAILVGTRHPRLANPRLSRILIPGNPVITGSNIGDSWSPLRRLSSFSMVLFIGLILTVVYGGPLLYGAIAYWRLYARHGLNDWAVTASLFVSSLLIIVGSLTSFSTASSWVVPRWSEGHTARTRRPVD